MSAAKESTPITTTLGKLMSKVAFALLAAASLLAAPQSQQPALQISSPANGSTINPGHTLSVTVTSPAGLTFQMVAIIGPAPIGFNTSGASIPAQFSITIPPDADCQIYTLTADGLTQSGQSVSSAPIQIDIERPDFPAALSASDSSLNLESQGEQTHLVVLAGFLDGSQIDVTQSTLVSYVSSNAAIATVDSSGTVTAMAAGSASITVTYVLGSQNLQISIPVTVQNPMLNTSPSSISFTTQSIGTSSPPQPLILTNAATSGVTVLNVATSGDFSETDNCISSSPLSVGASCTVNVSFTPTTTGTRTGSVSVANSANTAPALVSLTGTGTAAPAPPTITNLSPNSGAVGTSVTITGSNFGASQGTNTVTFNGTKATPTGWSATSIVALVPAGATTGNVVVTVGGVASNGVGFTVSTLGYVQGNMANSASTASFLAPQVAGDLNVVVVGEGSVPTSITDSAGNTYSLAVGSWTDSYCVSKTAKGVIGLLIYYAQNIKSSAAGNTVTVTGSEEFIMIGEYAGVSSSGALDVTAKGSGDGGFTMSATTQSATTSNAHDLLIAADISPGGVSGAGPGYTQRLLPSFGILEDQIVTQTGSYSASAPLNGLTDACGTVYPFVMEMVVFRAAH
jgi:hypothetical protein